MRWSVTRWLACLLVGVALAQGAVERSPVKYIGFPPAAQTMDDPGGSGGGGGGG